MGGNCLDFSLHFVLRLDEIAGRRHHEIRRRVKVGRRVRARHETRLRVKAKRPHAGRVVHREVGSAAVGAQAAMGGWAGQMGARIDGGEYIGQTEGGRVVSRCGRIDGGENIWGTDK